MPSMNFYADIKSNDKQNWLQFFNAVSTALAQVD